MKRSIAIIVFLLIPSFAWAAPRYGATLDSLRTAVRGVLGETNTNRFPDSVLNVFINEGQIRVAIDCGAYRKKAVIAISATDVDSVFFDAPDDAIEGWPCDVLFSFPNAQDVKSKWRGLKWLAFWEWAATDEDSPRNFSGYVHAGEFVVFPPPVDTGSFYVYYRALPTALHLDTAHTAIPETDRPGIVSYAAKRAAESSGWDAMGALQTAEYERHVAARMLDMVAPKYEIKPGVVAP